VNLVLSADFILIMIITIIMIKFIRKLASFSKYYALCDIDAEDCEYVPIPESSIV